MLCNEDTDTCDDCTSNADCNDGITCTTDVCNGATGICQSWPDDSRCPDPLFCNGWDMCDPEHPDADVDGCIPDPYACANACDETTDTCFNCTSNADCDDGLDCTNDVCNGLTGECSHWDNCTSGSCNYLTGACE